MLQYFRVIVSGLILALTCNYPVYSQTAIAPDPLQYADLADLSVNAPVIVQATVKKAVKVSPERAPNAPIGTERYYVEASTDALIRGRGGIPDMIRYVIDLPLDSRGRAPKIKRQTFIIFAQNGTGGAGNIQLVARDAQISWTPDRDARVRALVREIVKQDAPPTINGIGSAFHVPGTILGEGETQVFLKTENGQPVSLTILSRDGQKKRWAVSLGEIVDEAAKAPVRNSLLWYRLACFLPRDLPFEALEGVSPSNANQARLDYRMVIQDLGNCPRARRTNDR